MDKLVERPTCRCRTRVTCMPAATEVEDQAICRAGSPRSAPRQPRKASRSPSMISTSMFELAPESAR
jgi:hypothetical protein